MIRTRYYWKYNRPLLGAIRREGSIWFFLKELISLVLSDLFGKSLPEDLQAWFNEEAEKYHVEEGEWIITEKLDGANIRIIVDE